MSSTPALRPASSPSGYSGSSSSWGTGPTLLAVLAAGVIVMAGMRDAASLIGPVFFSLTLALAGRPLAGWLRAHGLPLWASTVLVLVGLYAVLLAMMYGVGTAVYQLAETLPSYSDQFNALYQQGLHFLARFGIDEQRATAVIKGFDLTSLVGIAQTLLAQLQAATTLMLFIFLTIAFLVLDLAEISGRARMVRGARPALAEALEDFGWRVRTYWIYSAIFGVVLAVCDYIALLVLGVPLALSWAIFAFICNFVPNVGFALALIPPTLLALLDGGPTKALWVLGCYVVISFVVQTLLLPRVMGDAVGLNTTSTFMSLVFWTSIIGGLGAVLAIPLTLFFKAIIIDATPGLRWVGAFLTGEPAGAEPAGGRSSGHPSILPASHPDEA